MIQYTEELANEICDRLIEGESMRRIALSPNMPSRNTMLRWIDDETKDFGSKCARARLMQADTMDDMVLDLIDKVDADNAHAMKVKLSAIQWRASKLNPKKYGEKLDLNHGGSVGVQLVNDIPRPKRD
jgi:hypothetical protein